MLKLNEIFIKLAGQTIVRDFSLVLERGQCIALLGASGCGKTTILRAIAGLIPVQFGDVLSVSQRLAYLFQEPRLLPWLTVRENLRLVAPQASEQTLLQQLDEFHLTALDANKYPDELSGGMKQRVALARALITQPDLLLMDEPFSALDQTLRQELQQHIMQKVEQGLAVVLVTHDIQEAVRMAHQIYCLCHKPAQCTTQIQLDQPYALRQQDWIQQQSQHPALQSIAFDNTRV
ncbi:ABC transporter ATP-binding protein [Pasteurellaceae bacterium LIM206]|nr:ABC transporter ATP-binding protein [Pasteurellaceae bacterium LIM206]